jgi:hypothetical protein
MSMLAHIHPPRVLGIKNWCPNCICRLLSLINPESSFIKISRSTLLLAIVSRAMMEDQYLGPKHNFSIIA